MKIEQANTYRDSLIAMLTAEKLPTADLPFVLDNFFISKHNDKITGAAGLEIYADYSLLRSLVVSKDFRSRGIATGLMLYIEQIAALKKLKAIYLLTETASAYFEQRGYQKIERTAVPLPVQQSSEFSQVCPQSAIVMFKSITQ
jgi:amino-acid N-acetyltransferase